MPRTILTDAPVKKLDRKTTIRIADIPSPDVSSVLYTDLHKDAGRGLCLKVEKSGKKSWVLAYYKLGKRHVKTLGEWPHMKPAQARIEAGNLRDALKKDPDFDPIPERWSKQKQEAREAQESARIAKAELTLGNLLLAYVEQLNRKGKASARSVETCVQKNVQTAFPKLWKKLAEDIGLDDCVEIVAALADGDKMREAAKLRSYLRAAFTVAIKARGDASAVPALRNFRLKQNPAAALATIEGNVKARQRALELPELRAYWKRINALPSPDGAVLRFHLLTGGQRLEQLFRLTTADRDGDNIILLDPKGRRKEPRVHVVPLLPEAIKALDEIGNGPFLVSFDGGQTQVTDSAFRVRVNTLSAAMLKDGEVTETFTPGDIRRTVETRLGAAKVSSDHLKHLMSHGFGGVQDRHYQRYEYHSEKLAALTVLRDLLTAPGGDVVPMKRRAKQ